MPHPLPIFSQSDYLIHIVDKNSNTEWQIVQIQISWLPQKPIDLDLHCLQRHGISWFSRTRIKVVIITADDILNFFVFFRENKAWHFMWIICLVLFALHTSSIIFLSIPNVLIICNPPPTPLHTHIHTRVGDGGAIVQGSVIFFEFSYSAK